MTTERLTESQHLEQRITQALVTIRREWDAMMPTGPAAVRPSMGGSGGAAGIVGDSSAPWLDDLGRPHWRTDHARGGADVDPTTRLLSLRREVAEILNSWSRVVMEDRPVTEPPIRCDGLVREPITLRWPQRGPVPIERTAVVCHCGRRTPLIDGHLHWLDGGNVPDLCAFLERHAAWMAEHEAAHDCAEEVADLARQVEGVASPKVKQWVGLGSCPLKIEQEVDGRLVMVVCGGQVRAWPKPGDRDGEVDARCDRCGEEAVTRWWEARMFDDSELSRLLTYDGVALAAHRVLGRPVQRATVKMWASRGIITPLTMRDEKGRTLFAREATVRAIHEWALPGDTIAQDT